MVKKVLERRGVKPLPAGEKKKQLWFYIREKHVAALGGKAAVTELAYAAIKEKTDLLDLINK